MFEEFTKKDIILLVISYMFSVLMYGLAFGVTTSLFLGSLEIEIYGVSKWVYIIGLFFSISCIGNGFRRFFKELRNIVTEANVLETK